MLDLQPGVHLEEIKASVLAGDELDGASRIVIDRLRERDCLFSHPSARLGVDERRWRFLDHLLVAALDRAFALAEIDDMAMLVAKHLDLDMARIDNEFLNEHPIVAERGFRLRTGAGETFRHLLARVGDPHALAAAAGRGLDHDRIADLVGDLGRPLRRFDHAKIARHSRDLGGIGEFLRFNLVAHRLDGPGVGTDEDDLRRGERMGERRALGEKPVARMDRLGAGRLAGVNDLVDHEIGLSRGGRADGDRLIGHFDMKRVLVGFRIDGDGLDAHAARRLDDAAGDLAAVGDEDLLEHRRPNRRKARASRSGVLLEGRGRVNDRWDLRPSTNGLAPALGACFQEQTSTCRQASLSTDAADIAAVTRRSDRPCERRPGPRNSAEAGVAWADHPGDWIGRVGERLGHGQARRTKGAGCEHGHEQGCIFRHVASLAPIAGSLMTRAPRRADR